MVMTTGGNLGDSNRRRVRRAAISATAETTKSHKNAPRSVRDASHHNQHGGAIKRGGRKGK